MTESASAYFKAALGGSFDVTRKPPTEVWHQICVCGHPGNKHSPAAGGNYPPEKVPKDTPKVVYALELCYGQPKARSGSESIFERVGKSDDGRARLRLIPTCPCDEFRPVLEVRDPRFRFYQRRPTTESRSGIRDYDPHRHALMVGLRATRTSVSKMKTVKLAAAEGKSKEQIEELINDTFNSRVRTLDTWRCMAPDCDATDGVLPVYDENDRSELRCSEHRP